MGTTSYTCKALGSKEISSSDVAINKTYFDQSGLPATQKATLRLKVSLHEVGHFIGLGHSTAPKAVMKQGKLFYDDIYLDDINGYSDLY